MFTAGDIAKAPKYIKHPLWNASFSWILNHYIAIKHFGGIQSQPCFMFGLSIHFLILIIGWDTWQLDLKTNGVVFKDISPSRPPPSLPQSNAFAPWVPPNTWHLHPPTSLRLDFKKPLNLQFEIRNALEPSLTPTNWDWNWIQFHHGNGSSVVCQRQATSGLWHCQRRYLLPGWQDTARQKPTKTLAVEPSRPMTPTNE